jgi:hypothetical protein
MVRGREMDSQPCISYERNTCPKCHESTQTAITSSTILPALDSSRCFGQPYSLRFFRPLSHGGASAKGISAATFHTLQFCICDFDSDQRQRSTITNQQSRYVHCHTATVDRTRRLTIPQMGALKCKHFRNRNTTARS